MADKPEKWWVDPTYDPMQDLHDCKNNINLMAPAMQQHAKVISELINQNNKLTDIVQQDRLEIALLSKEMLNLRNRLLILETMPISDMVSKDSVK